MIHRNCLVLWSLDVFHYDLRGDSLQMRVCGNAGCLFMIDFEGWIHRDCLFLWSSDVFHYDLRGDSLQVEVCGNAGCLI